VHEAGAARDIENRQQGMSSTTTPLRRGTTRHPRGVAALVCAPAKDPAGRQRDATSARPEPQPALTCRRSSRHRRQRVSDVISMPVASG